MPICPTCNGSLQKARNPDHVFWMCPACGGRSSTISVMRRMMSTKVVNDLWLNVRKGTYPKVRDCPFCTQKMAQITVLNQSFCIDVCKTCTSVWFDPTEYDVIPAQEQKPLVEHEELPLEIKQMLAKEQIKEMRAKAVRNQSTPDEIWKYIPAFLGIPVEYDGECKRIAPVVTWAVAGLVLIISLLAFTDLEPIVETLGLIPEEYARHHGLTFVTAFFLHGGVGHLIGNLYFLLVFGDNVEEDLGGLTFLLLLFVAAFIGDIAHIMLDPTSTIPCIGASGGISGILIYYALRYPRKHVGLIFWFRWVRFPVIVYFLFWITLQIIGVWLGGDTHIAYAAHLGGALTGFIFWVLHKLLTTKAAHRLDYT